MDCSVLTKRAGSSPLRVGAVFVLTAIVALLPLAVPWLQFVLTIAVAEGFAALGIGLLLRADLVSLGHAMFFACGAYTVAFMQRFGVHDILLLLIAATVISTAAGMVVGAFMVRYRAIFFAMLNLAVSMVVFALLAKLYGLTGGTDGMDVSKPTAFGVALAQATFANTTFYGGLILMLAIGFIVQRYIASPLGQALSAVGSNEVRVQYLGISVYGILLTAYTISAALAGLGGAIAAMTIGHVLPEMSYWTQSGDLLLMAVLGGVSGAAGPFVGAIFLGLVHTAATAYAKQFWNLITGAALIIVIFFLPTGLYGIGARLFSRKAGS